jgi:hypothetical protein
MKNFQLKINEINIDSLTIEEILDEEDIVNELRYTNQKTINKLNSL